MVDLSAALQARKVALEKTKQQNLKGLTPDITKESIAASLKAAGILDAHGHVVTLVKSS